MAEVVGAVCGVQAQVMAAAELAVSARVAGITRKDVQEALWERRTLVKTWSIRGTLHLHPARELPLWTAANRTETYWHEPRWLEQYGLTAKQAHSILEAIGDALEGRRLTREQLGEEVARRAGSWAKRKTKAIQFGELASTWPQLLGPAADTGVLCFGPNEGARVTFVRADEWVSWQELDPHESFAKVFLRYLAAYGPATHRDFAHWFRIKPPKAAGLVESLADELVEVEVEGHRALLPARDAGLPEVMPGRSVRLVPAYDCYVIGAHPPEWQRSRLIPEAVRRRVFDRGAGPFPVLLIDGLAAGAWERRSRRKTVELEVEPFRRLTREEHRLLEADADRVGEFLGARVALSVGSAR